MYVKPFIVILLSIFLIGNLHGQHRSEKKHFYKHIYKKHGENIDTLIQWAEDPDFRLRLFAALKLDDLKRSEATGALLNALNVSSIFPEKKGTVHIYSSLSPPPANARLDRIWKDAPREIIVNAINNLLNSKYGRASTFNYLVQQAELACVFSQENSMINQNQCLKSISDQIDSVDYEIIKHGSFEDREDYVNTTLKPLLIEWFGDLVPQD